MRDYEVVYIFKSSLTSEEIENRLVRYHQQILAQDGAEITAVEHWGKRQLAYPIDRDENGYYVVAQFTAGPSVLPEYERVLKLDDGLLRHLIVLSEGQLPTPPSMRERMDETAEVKAAAEETAEVKAAAEETAEVEVAAEETAEVEVAAEETAEVEVAAEETAEVEAAADEVVEVEAAADEVVEVEAAADEVVEEDSEEETVRSEGA
jgi:small subunit ribosomal protein S6